jgi:hypothetical protein
VLAFTTSPSSFSSIFSFSSFLLYITVDGPFLAKPDFAANPTICKLIIIDKWGNDDYPIFRHDF